ncbi:MAG: putative ABC transporter permease [Candidatus Howiella sp.]|jgi:uncharacterized membrane protein
MKSTIEQEKLELQAASPTPPDPLEDTKEMEPILPEDDAPIKIKKRPAPKVYAVTPNRLFWVFMIGSVVGVVIEVLWCLFVNHRFESRQGLVYGWFNLVYGLGAAAITLGLQWLAKRRDIWIFFGGAVIGAAFEYLCSWFQEVVFGTVSWQYDDMAFNLNGRINLLYSMFWGLLALFWLRLLYPLICRLIDRIPHRLNTVLVWTLTIFMIFNSLMSAAAVARMTGRRAGNPPNSRIELFLDQHFPDERLQKIYPNMVYTTPPLPEDAPRRPAKSNLSSGV